VLRPTAREAATALGAIDVDHAVAQDAFDICRVALGSAAEVELPELDARLLHHVGSGGRELNGDVRGGALEVRLDLAEGTLEDSWSAAIFDDDAR
jgi:hypothetical protein